MTDSFKLYLGNKQVLVETNEVPISNKAEETFNDTDNNQSDINKTFKKEIENKQKKLVNTDNTIKLLDNNNVDNNNVDISVNLLSNENIIVKSPDGLSTNLSIKFDSKNKEIQLLGKDEQLVSSAKIPSSETESYAYRGIFNDINSARYLLADTITNNDIILLITDNQYYQYSATDDTFNIVNNASIINNIQNKQDTIQDSDDTKIENNVSNLTDTDGNNITDTDGNIIKQVKKNILVKNPEFLGIYKNNSINNNNCKDGDIIYNNETKTYQSFNKTNNTWENYNDLRILQSIKSLQTSIKLPPNSPLMFSKRLKQGSTVELEEVLTSNFTRFRWDMDHTTYDEIVNLPEARKYNGDIFRLKDNSLVMYVCEEFVDANYKVTKLEDYVYIKDNRRVELSLANYLKPYSSSWSFSFISAGMLLKNDIAEINGYISITRASSVAVGYYSIIKINTNTLKEGYMVDNTKFVNNGNYYFRNDNIGVFCNDKYFITTIRTKITDTNGNIEFQFYFTQEIVDLINSYSIGFTISNYFIPLIKK